jgi:hypothetical protein
MAWLAFTDKGIHWALALLLVVATICLIAMTFVAIDHYIRTHDIQRAVRLQGISFAGGAFDKSKQEMALGLTATIQNTSKVHHVFARLVYGHITVQGRAPQSINIVDMVVEIGPESSARIDFPGVTEIKVGPTMNGQIDLGIKFGRKKSSMHYLLYLEDRLELAVSQDDKGIGVNMRDTVVEATYGRTAKAEA